MEAVKENKDYLLHYTREVTGEVIEKTVNARELFRRIAETNWDYAEPGALFWDRITGWNLLSNTEDFAYAGVNPDVYKRQLRHIGAGSGAEQISCLCLESLCGQQ